MDFQATVVLGGKTATGIQVPDDVVAALGSGKRPPVVVTVGGYTYRTTVAPMGGASWVPLAAEHRRPPESRPTRRSTSASNWTRCRGR